MNVNYLSVLTTVNTGTKNDYTIVKNQNNNFKNFIMDSTNFTNADRDGDNFLTYSELSDIKLSPRFNVQKNLFELKNAYSFYKISSESRI